MNNRMFLSVCLCVTTAAIVAGLFGGCVQPMPRVQQPAPATPEVPVSPHDDIDVCWPEDQGVRITIALTGCGRDDTSAVTDTFNEWWDSDRSCMPEEILGECTRTVRRVCPHSYIETTYEPMSDEDGLLVVGIGNVTYPDGCVGSRLVEIRAVTP